MKNSNKCSYFRTLLTKARRHRIKSEDLSTATEADWNEKYGDDRRLAQKMRANRSYYRTLLKKADKYNINVVDLEVAYELNGCLNTKISDKKFDEACGLIKETYLKYEDLTIWAVTTALLDMTEDLEQADLTAITRRELGEKACYYL